MPTKPKKIIGGNLGRQLEFFGVELFWFIFNQLKDQKVLINSTLGELHINNIKENGRISGTNQISDIWFTLELQDKDNKVEDFEFLIESKAYFKDRNGSDKEVLKNLDSMYLFKDLLTNKLNRSYGGLYLIFRPAEGSIGNNTLLSKLDDWINNVAFFPDYYCEVTDQTSLNKDEIEKLCMDIKTIIKSSSFKDLQQNDIIRGANKDLCIKFISKYHKEVELLTSEVVKHLEKAIKNFENSDFRIEKILDLFKGLEADTLEFKDKTANGFVLEDNISEKKYKNDLKYATLSHQKYWASKRRFMNYRIFQEKIKKIEEKITNDLNTFTNSQPIINLKDYIEGKITLYFSHTFSLKSQKEFQVVFDSPLTNTGVIFFLGANHQCYFQYNNNEINFNIGSKSKYGK